MRKIILFGLFIFCLHNLFAQKKVVLEKLRCFSATGPTMNYFKDDATRKIIAIQLNRTLSQFRQASLLDTTTLADIEYVNNITSLATPDLSFTKTDSPYLHLYIDFLEIAPARFFSFPENRPTDTSILTRARSIFLLKASLLRSDKTVLFSEQLNIIVSASETAGMGIVFKYDNDAGRLNQVVATPKGFAELVRAATNLLFDPTNQLEMVEMRVSPAFFADNYILPNTINQPRTYVATTKNISSYNYNNRGEMIRMDEPVYEQIIFKGKKAQKYPDAIMTAIKTADNYNSSDFVFLRQECRDVVRDKNYLLKLITQVDPANILPPLLVFTGFLPGNCHYLFLEKDTLANFSIVKNVIAPDKKIYLNKVSNGNDSSSFLALIAAYSELKVVYDYVVTGTISKQNFSIKCSGFTNTVKEIFLNEKLVCIAQGKFSPEKFVVFDASLSPELLNQLYMIGFNRFFE